MGGLPDRWMAYRPIGKVIPGTRFIAFKVPLKEALCKSLQINERFTPQQLIADMPIISLIIDLTNTTRYYDKNVFQKANKSYVKIFCPGHIIPAKKIISQFFASVDKFLSDHPDDGTLIGVHCTHGVNRTGYFICKYMIDRMGIDPNIAIADVGRARGYPIERENYLQDLKRGDVMVSPSDDQPAENWRDRVIPDNARERFSNDRNAQYQRDRKNWRRDGGRSRSPMGNNSRYARGGGRYQPNPRDGSSDSGRGQSWNDRSRSYGPGCSRDDSSEWYSRSRSPLGGSYRGRSRSGDWSGGNDWSNYSDRPNYERPKYSGRRQFNGRRNDCSR